MTIKILVVLRIPRALYALTYVRTFKYIFQVFIKLIPFCYYLTLTLSIIFYFYGIIGMFLFGGKLTTNTDLESLGIP